MLVSLALVLLAHPQFQKPFKNEQPPASGQRLEVKDGDTILVRGGARIRIVHRSEGTVRLIYNSAQHWVVMLTDYADPAGAAPDGRVDGNYRFDDVDGAWPFGERWEGSAVIDDYSLSQGGGSRGVGITTNVGFVQVLSPVNSEWFRDLRATAILTYRGGGGGNSPGGRLSFDEAERRFVDEAVQAADRSAARGTSSPMESTPGTVMPVRVGSGLRTPRKVVDAQPIYPALALSARVQGVVILEIRIGTDGSVTDAKILRSIPLLDQAALDCVRQWKYEPTQINGVNVPVIMTVTVNFATQDVPPDSPPSSNR